MSEEIAGDDEAGGEIVTAANFLQRLQLGSIFDDIGEAFHPYLVIIGYISQLYEEAVREFEIDDLKIEGVNAITTCTFSVDKEIISPETLSHNLGIIEDAFPNEIKRISVGHPGEDRKYEVYFEFTEPIDDFDLF